MTEIAVVGIRRYRFGVVTAIPKEFAAMRALLEEPQPAGLAGDPNDYVLGSIPAIDGSGSHRVVVAMLKMAGNNSASATVSHLLRSFPNVAEILMVGIAGGVPQPADAGKHVRLGDIVVSNEYGVLQWDATNLSPGSLIYRGLSVPPSAALLGKAKVLEANRIAGSHPWESYMARAATLEGSARPPAESDRLFDSLDQAVEISHPADSGRSDHPQRIHLGRVGSGNSVLKDPATRDSLRDQHGIRAIEMEGSGVADATWNAGQGYIVIRGISDYCDTHKNDDWQGYAALAASAYARALIESFPATLDPAWDVLAEHSKRNLEAVLDTIDSRRLLRTDLIETCRRATVRNRAVAIIGSSGAGKSAAAKRLAGTLQTGRAFFLRADELSTIESRLATGFGHSISSLLRDETAESALMVLDGVDRLKGDSQFVADLIRALELSSPASPWRVLLTCETKSWARFLDDLLDMDVDLRSATPVRCVVTKKERLAIADATPSLRPLVSRDDLEPITSNLKMLDILARGAAEVGLADSSAWVSESSLIEWFWERYVRGRGRSVLHARVLESIAVRQSDLGAGTMAITDLSSGEALLIPELERLALVTERDGAVRLTHDLIGDYARQRFLLAQLAAEKTDELRRRLTTPLWHSAISLVALHYLESLESTVARGAEGLRAVARTIGGEASPGLSMDLTLEAVGRSIQVVSLLERFQSELLANDGELLRRFLRRFLITETLPHPGIKAARTQLSPSLRAAAEERFRIPDGHNWTPVIRWMVQNASDALARAPAECLRVAETWFGLAEGAGVARLSLPFAIDLGRLMIALAERTADLSRPVGRATSTSLDAEMSSRLYNLALECASDDPDRLRVVARRLAGRDSPSGQSKESAVRVDPSRRVLLDPREQVGPWPNGPLSPPNPIFRTVAFSQEGARRLVKMDLTLAVESFLSLLIKPEREEYDFQAIEDLEKECELERVEAATPPFKDFAPARALLEADVSVGLDFCTTIINFATDRWAEGKRRIGTSWYDSASSDVTLPRQNDVPGIQLRLGALTKRYTGDETVFRWRSGIWGPHVASAVLMTLEGWLYEAADSNRLEHSWLERLLNDGTSVAMLGLLTEVALRHPNLLFGPLEPLIGAPEIYYLGRIREVRERPDTALIWWRGPNRSIARKQAVEWHTMPHRKDTFEAVVFRALETRPPLWPALETARQRWISGRSEQAEQNVPILAQLIAEFDPSNFRPCSDGFEYVPPESSHVSPVIEQRVHEDLMSATVFSIRCEELLGQDLELSVAEIEALLAAAQHLASVDTTQLPIVIPPEQPRCAAAAVAILKGQPAINTRPDLLTRSREAILTACFGPPAPDLLETRSNLSDGSWDHFCALGVARLLQDRPNDPDLERAMGSLLLAPHDETVALVLQGAARVRHENPRLLSRLLHLGVLFARLLYIEAREHDDPRGRQATRRRLTLLRRFSDGAIGSLPVNWLALATARGARFEPFPISIWKSLIECFGRDQQGSTSGFDGRYLAAAFQWLRDAAADGSAGDRDFVLTLIRDVHRLVTERANDEVGRFREQHSGGVGPALLKLASDTAAEFVTSEQRAERRRRIWLPWLQVPVPAEPGLEEPYKRAEMFLDALYRIGLDRAEAPRGFATAISEIFEFALSFEGPIRPHEARFFSGQLAAALLGVKSRFESSSDRWTAPKADLADALSGFWQRWASVALGWHGCAEHFLTLLKTPATEGVRRTSLLWLAEAPDQSWLGDERCALPLVAFLEDVAAELATSGGPTSQEEEAFKKLLSPLLEDQYERALLLAKRIRERGWLE